LQVLQSKYLKGETNMSQPNQSKQDSYVEPIVETNRETVDPLGAATFENPNDVNNICPPGGC
jgi:hypothetical protein